VRFSSSKDEVEKSLNKSVLADVVALVSSENNKLATKYLDEGNLEMSRKVLRDNVEYLNKNGAMVPEDKRIMNISGSNAGQLRLLETANSNRDESALSARKSQLFLQNGIDTQQRAVGEPSKP
jgi:hypothetical protein